MIELEPNLRDDYSVQWFERRLKRLQAYFELGDRAGFTREAEMLYEVARTGYISDHWQDSDARPYTGGE